MKVFLNVPYREKDEAKKMGAKWCQEKKKWYAIENSKEIEYLLKRWKTKETALDYLTNTTKTKTKTKTVIKQIRQDIPLENTDKPRFSASDIASLIGQNPYKSKDETLLKTLRMMPKFKNVITDVKKRTGTKSEKEIIKDASPEIKLVLKESIEIAVASKSSKEIEKTIHTLKEKLVLTIVEETLLGIRETQNNDMKNAMVRINEGKTTLKDECILLNSNLVVIDTIEKTKEINVLISEIQKQRGIQLEDVVEDQYCLKTEIPVLERNTFTEFECDQYKLIGYIDGMVNNTVMETKNRRRFWSEPPEYDITQLRCYMFMKGKIDGILYENFPERDARETFVLWDDEKWESIHDELCEIVVFIDTLSIEEVEKMAHNVFTSSS